MGFLEGTLHVLRMPVELPQESAVGWVEYLLLLTALAIFGFLIVMRISR